MVETKCSVPKSGSWWSDEFLSTHRFYPMPNSLMLKCMDCDKKMSIAQYISSGGPISRSPMESGKTIENVISITVNPKKQSFFRKLAIGFLKVVHKVLFKLYKVFQ